MSLLSFCPGRHGAGRGAGEGPELPERAQVILIIMMILQWGRYNLGQNLKSLYLQQ